MGFNTCAVTGEAVRQARQAIRKARRERPGSRLIVTGCAAQIDPAAFAAMPEVDLVLGNAEKAAPGAYSGDIGAAAEARVKVNDIFSVKETAGHLIDGLKDRARAYVEVQNGCDPPLHLLRDPLRPGQFAFGRRRRGGGAGAPPGRPGLPRSGDHRGRHYLLGPGPAGPADPGPAGRPHPEAGSPIAAPAALLHRRGRDRPGPDAGDRAGRAPAAAPAPVAPARRRHGPEADEAPPFARRQPEADRRRARPCAPTPPSAPT